MNPNQYPPQPGQSPQGYPPQGPQGPYPQPGQPQPGPYPPHPEQAFGPQPGSQPAPPAGYGAQPPYPQQPGMGPMGPPGPLNPMGPGAPGPMPPQHAPTPGYNPYPYSGEYDQPAPRRKRGGGKLFLGIVVIVLIVTVMIAALASGGGGGNTGNQNQNQTTGETTTPVEDVMPRSDGRLELGQRTSATDNLKAQTVQAAEREQVNLSSGFSFMVNQVEGYTSPNPTTKPAKNKKFVVATIVVGNRSNSNLSVSYLDFRLRDESNQLIPGHITTNEILNNPLSNPTELKPGDQITGKIIFEVDKVDTQWVFKHSETYQKTTDNTTFTVEGEITVKLATGTTPASPPPTSPTPATN